jgi:basic amino acid/polyamine antiporter, APA family
MSSLQRKLGVRDATAIVVGSIIGSGVFLKTGIMAQEAGTPALVMTAWMLAGLMSLAGALTYAELVSFFPKAGGEYIFLREAYGSFPAFLYGWMRFWIAAPGSIAAGAVGAATFLSAILPLTSFERSFSAVLFISLFTSINCFSVGFGGRIQSFMTALKVFLIGGLILGIFFAPVVEGNDFAIQASHGWSHFGLAVLAALWAFDGWNNLPMVAGEVRDPQKNLPIALVGGLCLVILIYCGANFAYFHALPFGEILNAQSTIYPDALPVATKAAQSLFGNNASRILSIAFVLSALGAMNGSVLTGARVPYAMAIDGLFFKFFSRINNKTLVPVTAILAQGFWASVLALSGTFYQITDCVVFASWIFYGLVTFSIFIFRKRGCKSTYRTPLYPLIPAVFVLCAVVLVLNTLLEAPKESLFGVIFILAGIPAYLGFQKFKPK